MITRKVLAFFKPMLTLFLSLLVPFYRAVILLKPLFALLKSILAFFKPILALFQAMGPLLCVVILLILQRLITILLLSPMLGTYLQYDIQNLPGRWSWHAPNRCSGRLHNWCSFPLSACQGLHGWFQHPNGRGHLLWRMRTEQHWLHAESLPRDQRWSNWASSRIWRSVEMIHKDYW